MNIRALVGRMARPLPPHVLAALGFAALLAQSAMSQSAPAQDSTAYPRAARTIARGETIAPSDILFDTTTSAAAQSVAGLVARRMIRLGEPLRPPAIGRAPLVLVGQTVMVNAVFGGASIARQGIAQTAGALGDSIHVRLDQRNTVTGIVTGRASITIAR